MEGMVTRDNRLKKALMRTLWRVQQSQLVISIVFWSLTLTGIFYDKVATRFDNFGLGTSNVLGGMAVLFVLVLSSVLLMGIAYDRFRFWNEQVTVTQERNPYTYGGKVAPNHLILWRALIEPTEENRALALALLGSNLSDPSIRAHYLQLVKQLEGDSACPVCGGSVEECFVTCAEDVHPMKLVRRRQCADCHEVVD